MQPRYSNSASNTMDNIVWVSPNENDGRYAAINVINTDSTLYAFGYSSDGMLGRGDDVAANPDIPDGITAAFKITSVNTGGHTTMITRKCATNFGYVGHRVRGSMGNGSAADVYLDTYTFATADVPVCGTATSTLELTPTVTGPNGFFCENTTFDVTTSIPGGTLTATGPVTITGNSTSGYQIVFNAPGFSLLTYQLPPNECGISPLPATLNVQAENCDADLDISKTVNIPNPSVGQNVVFTITAGNNGPNNATGVNVADLLPAGYSYVSHSGPGTYNNVTGIWNIGNFSNSSPDRVLQITATVLSSGNYRNVASITGDQPDPNTSNNTANVCINPPLGGPNAVCVGSQIIVTPSSGGSWSSNNSGRATVNNSGIVTGISTGNVTLTFIQSGSGCTNTKTVTVNPNPTLGGPSAVCVGSTITVTPTSGGTWSSNNGNVTVTNSGVVSGITAGTSTLTFTQTSTGCSSTRVITVNPNPTPNITSSSAALCVNDIRSLTGTPSGGTFTIQSGPGNISGSTLTATGAGTIVVRYSVTVLGCTSTTTQNITVNGLPSTAIVGTITQPTCTTPTGSVVLSGLPSGNWTITGSPSGGATGSGSSTTISGLAPNQTYTFTVTNNNGCTSASSTSNVVINAIPNNPTLGGPSVVCAGSTITVTPTSGGTWSSNNGNVTVTNAGLVTGITAGTSTLTFTQTSTGCSSTRVITVNALPIVSVSGTTTICSGDPAVNFTFTGTPNAEVTYNVDGGANTTISLNGAGTASLVASNTATSTVNLVSVENTTTNCSQTQTGSATITVSVPPTISLTTSTDLSDCGANDGTIEIDGLIPFNTYTININSNSQVVTPTSSNFIFTGLSNGSYNISVENADNCLSNVLTNVLIDEPGVPGAPTGIGCD